jgi:hypothetical protein
VLLTSLIVSVVLTIVLNLVVRGFPGATDRGMRRIDGWVESQSQAQRGDRRVHVFFPWKSMLIASLVLTVLLNVIVRVL